jgi:CheY-like chemotaxis protein/HPt (histidine-containing phosphotransfer) domain-containing protein
LGAPAAVETPPARAERSTAAVPLRILLAEDDELNQRATVSGLERCGHTVVVAGTGMETLAALQRQHFDVVLMDVQMPDMDGFTVTARIRQREQEAQANQSTPSTTNGGARPIRMPIIAITAHSARGDRARCLAAGMDAYVGKPFRIQALLEVINAVVSRSNVVVEISPSAPAVPLVFDRQTALDQIDGDIGLLRELVASFQNKRARLLADIRDAVSRGDGQAVEFAAHGLRGAAGLVGGSAVLAAAQRLEMIGGDGQLRDSEDAYAALVTEMERLSTALGDFLEHPS